MNLEILIILCIVFHLLYCSEAGILCRHKACVISCCVTLFNVLSSSAALSIPKFLSETHTHTLSQQLFFPLWEERYFGKGVKKYFSPCLSLILCVNSNFTSSIGHVHPALKRWEVYPSFSPFLSSSPHNGFSCPLSFAVRRFPVVPLGPLVSFCLDTSLRASGVRPNKSHTLRGCGADPGLPIICPAERFKSCERVFVL